MPNRSRERGGVGTVLLIPHRNRKGERVGEFGDEHQEALWPGAGAHQKEVGDTICTYTDSKGRLA